MEAPQAFLEEMQTLLGEGYPAFAAALEAPPVRGLRVNTLKLTPAEFAALSPWRLSPSALCRDAFVLEDEARVGTHPYHHAGLFYMQEPSASAVVEALDPAPGMTVLDLCAAPGGKATHLASRLGGEGILVANECVASRVRPLLSNLERIGARNAVVTSCMPDELARRFGPCFDAVVVDAPCSGEGMFRREEEAVRAWSREHVAGCAARQSQILSCAAELVRAGGVLLYSTCTLNAYENEEVIDRFLRAHPEFVPEEIRAVRLPPAFGAERGYLDTVARAARLMPHTVRGEGHFIAKLRRTDGEEAELPLREGRAPDRRQSALFSDFWEEIASCAPWYEPVVRGDSVWLSPFETDGAVRAGVEAGRFVRGRFEPSHMLFPALRGGELRRRVSFPAESPQLQAWLRGEQLTADAPRGWCAVCVEAGDRVFPLGFGKASGGVVKNHYPKGLRNVR